MRSEHNDLFVSRAARLFAERTTTFAHSVVRRFQAEVVLLDLLQTTLPVGSKFAARARLRTDFSDTGPGSEPEFCPADHLPDLPRRMENTNTSKQLHRTETQDGPGPRSAQVSMLDEISHITRRCSAIPAAIFETAASWLSQMSIEHRCGHFHGGIATTRTEDACLLLGLFHKGFVHRIF